MTRHPPAHQILVIDDNPDSARKLAGLCKQHGRVQAHFADTPNAVTRTLADEPVSLVVIFVNENNVTLVEAIGRECHRKSDYLPLLAIVDPEAPDQITAALEAGADSLLSAGDDLRLATVLSRELGHITAHRDAASSLKRLEDIEARYTLLLDSSREAIAYVHEGLHIYANGAYLELFGQDDFHDLEGVSLLDLLSPANSSIDIKTLLRQPEEDELPDGNLSFTATRVGGESFAAAVSFSPARYYGEDCIQIMVREQVQAAEADPELQKELEKLRTTDSVTSLLNRGTFINQVEHAIVRPPDEGESAVLFIELVGTEELLEKIGMGSADTLACQTAEVLGHLTEANDTVGRVSDHTFGLLIHRTSREDVESTAKHLLDTYSGHIMQINDRSLTVAAAIGLTYLGKRSDDAGEILSQADSALNEALRADGNCFVRYRPRLAAVDGAEEQQWMQRIRHALDNDELMLVEQPIINMEADDVLFMLTETRLRPQDSEELYLPETYMPAATRAGLAPTLDRDSLEKLVPRMADQGGTRAWMTPISGASVNDEEFTEWLAGMIENSSLPANRLLLQFREADIRENLINAQRFMQRFLVRGCRFVLGDVGTGTPLQQLLKHLDVDFVMLRPEMTEDLSDNEDLRDELRAITSIAQERNIQIISPRVANANDMASLWHYGINLVQGDFVQDELRAAG